METVVSELAASHRHLLVLKGIVLNGCRCDLDCTKEVGTESATLRLVPCHRFDNVRPRLRSEH